jgi:hypothetical protein
LFGLELYDEGEAGRGPAAEPQAARGRSRKTGNCLATQKDKLEGLRLQIKAKRQERELSKTTHSMGDPRLTTNSTATAAYSSTQEQLFKLLLCEAKL